MVKNNIPVLPLRDIVVFPNMVAPLFVGREQSVNALNYVMTADKKIFLLIILREFGIDYLSLDYIETERNQPFKLFLSRMFETVENGSYDITPKLILDAYPSVQRILKVKGHL